MVLTVIQALIIRNLHSMSAPPGYLTDLFSAFGILQNHCLSLTCNPMSLGLKIELSSNREGCTTMPLDFFKIIIFILRQIDQLTSPRDPLTVKWFHILVIPFKNFYLQVQQKENSKQKYRVWIVYVASIYN